MWKRWFDSVDHIKRVKGSQVGAHSCPFKSSWALKWRYGCHLLPAFMKTGSHFHTHGWKGLWDYTSYSWAQHARRRRGSNPWKLALSLDHVSPHWSLAIIYSIVRWLVKCVCVTYLALGAGLKHHLFSDFTEVPVDSGIRTHDALPPDQVYPFWSYTRL